jgi:hypothetical protein
MASPEEMERARQEMFAAELQRTAKEIEKQGHTLFGKRTYDEAQNFVAKKLGERAPEFVTYIAEADTPAAVVMEYAADERRLEALAKLPPNRMLKDVIATEVKSKSYSPAITQNQPMWRNPGMTEGHVSAEEWRHTGGEGLSDEAWNKNFDRLSAERSRKVPR